ncbi:hypothetical protein CIW54_18185 [Paraburkholderia sp. T12-10]|nr:hypothetical protein CIW54_18185 [Paraburkholderia sp. T12-10]
MRPALAPDRVKGQLRLPFFIGASGARAQHMAGGTARDYNAGSRAPRRPPHQHDNRRPRPAPPA